MLYMMLFFKFFLIGALSFGGGYGALPLIESTVVNEMGWLNSAEFADLLTFSEITPGPIALNAASFAGYRAGGMIGSIAATLGCTLPSCIIVSILAAIYLKYRNGGALKSVLGCIRPAVCAMIFSSFLTVLLLATGGVDGGINTAAILLFLGALALLGTKKVPSAAVIVFSGICGLLIL